ncbi:MAG: efflux RND transporter periplasmic adaptor subunit [Phenylobacterium sp.]|uniref:efflux RND transporter periplasmic adaptor subunit n=1 Tax=Phenylobacterium sp. TaxID=1871053 RepID=UPI0025DBE66F|nr:efflux RND transporter periplasmic adaptor subunit [Phenylobacterium sp.]MBI1196917.1 efflux RND transporter periplasmic adaptor subunit [Phenylobacterium sp.]
MAIHDLRVVSEPEAARPGPPPRRRRWPWRRGLIVLALAAAGGFGAWSVLKPVEVKTAQVVTGEAVDAVYASGVVEYVRQASIAPVVTAPIRQVLAHEGDAVRPGQTLAQLDDGPQEGTTLQLEAQAALARATAARQTRLHEAGFGAKAAWEDALAQARAADAAAKSARARLADYRIKAPFAGRVIRREAEPGDLASVGKAMFVVADTGALRITADIDERDVGRLAVGQAAAVRSDSFPGQVFDARISEITPQGDSTGRVFRARLALDPDSTLKPGMTVEANLVTARRADAVLAPTAALRDGAVWLVRDGRARRQAVKTGTKGVERTEITEGLKAGQTVVLDPPEKLKDGTRLSIGS